MTYRFAEFKIIGLNSISNNRIISTAGKVAGKNADWYNAQSLGDNTIENIDWKTVKSWKYYSHEKSQVNSGFQHFFAVWNY